MGQKTEIAWTQSTWNPITGCSRVSEGCRNCYAERFAHRFSGPGKRYEGLTVLANGHPQWTGKIMFSEKALLLPLKWKDPRMIFVNSMSDLFHKDVTDEQRNQMFAVMGICQQHTFQVLTKRPERMKEYASMFSRKDMVNGAIWTLLGTPPWSKVVHAGMWRRPWPLPNVVLGTSIENQKAAEDRLDHLCEIACMGWRTMISFEPLLGPVDATGWWPFLGDKTWAIVGGESGPGARPMDPAWAHSLRDQCKSAGVPFFMKQMGSCFGPHKGQNIPEDLNIREFPR